MGELIIDPHSYNPTDYLTVKDPNFIPMLRDALAGDPEILKRAEFKSLNVDNLIKAIDWLAGADSQVSMDMKTLLANEGWRLKYYRKPPTPEEFLSYEWIGPQAESVWPNVRKAFIEFMDPNPLNPKRGLALSTSIGWGKTLLTNLCLAYEVVLFGLIRSPYRLLGHSPMTSYSQPYSALVQMEDGSFKKMGDIQVGDSVKPLIGKKSTVEKIIEQGNQKTYELYLTTGETIWCSMGHWWTVFDKDKNKYVRLQTYQLLENFENYYLPNEEEIRRDKELIIKCIKDFELSTYLDAPVHLAEVPTNLNLSFSTQVKSYTILGEEPHRCIQVSDPVHKYFTKIPHKKKVFPIDNCVAMCSYTLNKVWDLLGTPFEQFLEQSPYFEKVGRHDDISQINKEDESCTKCYYTTAARGSNKMLFRNNLSLSLISTEGALLGRTIIYSAMSELAWWEKNGWTKEEIYTFFTKAKQRVDSRMNGHYLGRYVIDSSPFSLESPIDKWIWENAKNDPKWYCVLGARWDYFKKEFPGYFDKNGEEIHNWDVGFQMFKGGKSEPPKAIFSEMEAEKYDPLDLMWCPRQQVDSKGILDFTDLATQNAVEFLRDYAGVPAGSSDRIFQSGKVLDAVFDNDLKNIYTSIIADAMEEPEHLIWNKIRDQFFINFSGNYMFYREPNAKRTLAVDQSEAQDVTGITMSHFEWVKLGNGDIVNVVVIDFTIAIIPKGGRINLDAIRYFIVDLIERGRLNIAMVNFDNFQSSPTKQYLERKGIPLDYISVDKQNEHYATFIDMIFHNRVFAGKNIFFKNNLRSIHIAQREGSGTLKYDHFKGKLCNESSDTSWENSHIGENAKDVADSACASVALLNRYEVEFAPTHEWKAHTSGENNRRETEKKLNELGFQL